MKKFFSRIKKRHDDDELEAGDEYLELNTDGEGGGHPKVMIRFYTINDFSDIKPILDTLREGYTIAIVNFKPLKEKDLVELKRSINKLKKTTEAIDGDITGFGDDYIVVAPSFAQIHRSAGSTSLKMDDD